LKRRRRRRKMEEYGYSSRIWLPRTTKCRLNENPSTPSYLNPGNPNTIAKWQEIGGI
jgi:hypothetical protein